MSKTVGQILKETRALKDISLQEAARATHIRLQYLQELENDRPELLPSRAQARGFLRLYAAFLELDGTQLLTLLESPPLPDEPLEDIPKPEESPELKSEAEEKKEESVAEPALQKPSAQPKKTNKVSAKLQALISKLPKFGKKKTTSPTPSSQAEDQAPTQLPPASKKGSKKEDRSAGKRKQASKNPARRVSPPAVPSEDTFKEVGSQMRRRREKLGLSLSDVEQFTRLRRIYVQAIEDGKFEDLPSSVQGRGMVANYAHFLEMDQDAVLNLYAEGLEAQRREKLQEKWTTKEPGIRLSIQLPEKIRRFLSPDLLLGSLVVVALFVFIFWGASQIFGDKSETAPTTAPSISEMLQSTTTPTLALESTAGLTGTESDEPTALAMETQVATQPVAPIATANAAPLQLYIVAQQRAWMRVTVDGNVEFEGRIIPGNAYTFSAQERILLLTGNGAALEAYFNQEYLGALGKIGEMVNLDFSAAGLSVPTPTITPTVLPSATPTPAPTFTPTPQGTATEE
ncbi:MAG TPA: DUF4115 domain-containing protein [Anaerolineaceae bacterium]|jgi:cytoskeleton protein RodZ|nr:DUF4115 domain-containing protein [Anaerolineaceae bacterium]